MKANFRTVAFDETEFWFDLPVGCTKVFGLYLFMEGERTHCCELRPSSRCDFVENAFIGLDSEHSFVEEHRLDDGGEATTYFRFLDPALLGDRVSRPVEFENDPRDELETEKEQREDLWEQAREYVRGNALEPLSLWNAQLGVMV